MHQAACARRVTGCSPLASSCSRAYSRTVSSIAKRSSPWPASACWIRLLSTSDDRPSSTDRSGILARIADGLGALERPRSGEHREAPEQALLGVGQQLVAPVDRLAQRLLPDRQIAAAADEQREPALEARQDLRRREDAGPAPRPARWPAAARRGGRRSRPRRRRSPPSARTTAAAPRPGARTARWPGCAPARRAGGSRAMSGTGSGGTGKHCSPETRRTARLVTSSVSAGVDSTSATSSGAAARSCSKLSRTSSVRARTVARTWARSASSTDPRSMRDRPSACASIGATSAASVSEPRPTK